jgi:hypothetical protein
VIEDGGLNSPFDFSNGETITVEAWINLESLDNNSHRYIIGKGRTGSKGFAKDNQNWALRVSGRDGLAHVNFLFATEFAPEQTVADAHWHRWTTTEGFLPGTGWHHVAVTYQFGQPDSIRGWLDGRVRDGFWDMGGATTQGPVVDDDAIWIGSGNSGSLANGFKGSIDEVGLHRERLSDEVLQRRFRREGPERAEPQLVEVEPTLASVPGKVVVYFRENVASHDRWLHVVDPTKGIDHSGEKGLDPAAPWELPSFFLPRLPYRYDAWGIRDGWKPAVMLQMIANIHLPAGNHRLLVRSRGLSRLWLDGKVVARTKPHSGSSDGHEPVQPLPAIPLPGHHPAGFGDQEVIVDLPWEHPGEFRLVFEGIVGSNKLRTETGELLVALMREGSQVFEIVAPKGNPVRTLLEEDFVQASGEIRSLLTEIDDRNRRMLATSQDPFWEKRHALARQWAERAKSESKGSIDSMLEEKMERARSTVSTHAPSERQNLEQVFGILRENCFRCHSNPGASGNRGEAFNNAKGGLQLDTLRGALLGGDSGEPAIVPHHPQQSPLLARVRSTDEGDRMPPTGAPLSTEKIEIIEDWIRRGAKWPALQTASIEDLELAPMTKDWQFLRRAFLDVVGVVPDEGDVRSFLRDQPQDRTAWVDKLLKDDRFADHWVSYWQDVLAENPNMLKPSLNNSGPFRFFLHESLRDDKPMDRLVTELILMRGSEREGGSAGFGLAADNDAPMASKGHILAGAFLGVEMQCARCHDAPFHQSKQRDLFSLAAMLSRKEVTVPKSSTVAQGFFDQLKERKSLIEVTLQPGEPVQPIWPLRLGSLRNPSDTFRFNEEDIINFVQDPGDSRERLAAIITMPLNERFPQVIVNRVWKRLMGAGFVEPAHDWEGQAASHPELLQSLAIDFVRSGYRLKYLVRQIMTSQAYQREARGNNLAAVPERRFFSAPDRRRMTAEQVADSLFHAAGMTMDVEEITFDPDGRRPPAAMTNLGRPSRAWMFASLSNERDRPSLSLPKAQLVADILEAFGWSGTRQNPRNQRETDPTVLQPGVLANSPVVSWLTRAAQGSGLAELANDAESPEDLLDLVFLRFLSRSPTADERTALVPIIREGFADRILPEGARYTFQPPPRLGRVSWSNHLVPEANLIKLEAEKRAREGPPVDSRLKESWRAAFEDVVWTVINSPEFVWVP